MNSQRPKFAGGMLRISSGKQRWLNFKMWKCALSPFRCPCGVGIHVRWSVQYKKCTCVDTSAASAATSKRPSSGAHGRQTAGLVYSEGRLLDQCCWWWVSRQWAMWVWAGHYPGTNKSASSSSWAGSRLVASCLEAHGGTTSTRSIGHDGHHSSAVDPFRNWMFLPSSKDGTDVTGIILVKRSAFWVQQWGWVLPARATTSNPSLWASSYVLPWWSILQSYLWFFLNSHNLMVMIIRHLTCQKVKKKIIFKMMLKSPWKSVLMMWSSDFMLLKVVLKSKFKFWIPSKSWCPFDPGGSNLLMAVVPDEFVANSMWIVFLQVSLMLWTTTGGGVHWTSWFLQAHLPRLRPAFQIRKEPKMDMTFWKEIKNFNLKFKSTFVIFKRFASYSTIFEAWLSLSLRPKSRRPWSPKRSPWMKSGKSWMNGEI